MRIAQIAPATERVPPLTYGGTEWVIYELTEQLIKMGHDVTLFASGDSITSAKLESVYPHGLRDAKLDDVYGPNAYKMLHIGKAYQMHEQFDIMHDHNGFISLPTANICQKPVIMTHHGQLFPDVRMVYQALTRPYLVSISKAQARGIDGLNHIGTVYDGLTMDDYPFSETREKFLLFVGRISLEKGVHYAIQAANYLNLKLIIAAKLEEPDRPYFNEYIAPRLSENIKWIGEIDYKERNKLMSKALCFLHPVFFKEPFGLTLIESMACGCPVVAFRRGSIPEIIQDGKTGFIVSDIGEMVEAIKKIDTIDRRYCREYAINTFNAKRMAQGYLRIYKKVLNIEKKMHERK